jgi:pyruvate kinase
MDLNHGYLHFRRTKIIATIGPASSSPEKIRELILKDLNVARINFPHGKPEDHLRTIEERRK